MDVTFNSQVNFGGNTSLILADGASITIVGNNGIVVYGNLNIYSQSEGTGSLSARATGDKNYGGYGIYAKGNISIIGGTITTTSDYNYGIYSDGGDITIKTTGDCVYEEAEADYSSAACIKCDYPFTMTGGTLKMTSSGDGGKGLNCDDIINIKGGIFSAITTGGNDDSKPKAVKGDKGIILSGGSFYAKVDKNWACDNGTDSEIASERVTVVGTPSEASYEKKEVKVVF